MAAGESGGKMRRLSTEVIAAGRTEIEEGLTHPRGTGLGTKRQA